MVDSPLGQTKYSILLLLLGGETTAEDLASQLGMNLSVVRRHLEDVTAGKLVNPSFKSAGSGRPSKYYSITLEGRRCRGFGSQQARFRLRSTFVYSRTKKNDTANASAELGTPACPLVL